jgi:hypothetical protein
LKPLSPQQIYKRTAERLNLPEDYVKDVVEYFYEHNRSGMYNILYIIFNLTGLGRWIIRPAKFWQRKKALEEMLSEDFVERRDKRGVTIKAEIMKRHEQMEAIDPEVRKYYEYKKEKMS